MRVKEKKDFSEEKEYSGKQKMVIHTGGKQTQEGAKSCSHRD